MLNKNLKNLVFMSLVTSANVFGANQVDTADGVDQVIQDLVAEKGKFAKIRDGIVDFGKYTFANHKVDGLIAVAVAILFARTRKPAAPARAALDDAPAGADAPAAPADAAAVAARAADAADADADADKAALAAAATATA